MEGSGLYCASYDSHAAIELNINLLCVCAIQPYLAAEYTKRTAEVLSELKSAPQSIPVSICVMLWEPIFAAILAKCVLYVRVLSSVTPKYLGKGLCCPLFPQKVMFRLWIADLLLR